MLIGQFTSRGGKMNILILHCWGGDARGCWRGWLADRLREKGHIVVVPDLPDTMRPHLVAWLKEIRKHVKKFDDSWILVGHSLGCPTILRLLESFGAGEKIRAAFMVAAYADKFPGSEVIDNFVEGEFDWKKIKRGSGKFIIINSDNDPFINLSEGKRVAKLTGAEFIVERNSGHINAGAGWLKYERLLGLVLSFCG